MIKVIIFGIPSNLAGGGLGRQLALDAMGYDVRIAVSYAICASTSSVGEIVVEFVDARVGVESTGEAIYASVHGLQGNCIAVADLRKRVVDWTLGCIKSFLRRETQRLTSVTVCVIDASDSVLVMSEWQSTVGA